MKKILSYIFMFGAVAALTLSSCAKKEVYQPGEPDSETCFGVYFPSQEASGSHTFDPEMERTLTVTVARNQEKPYIDKAITVPYVIKSDTDGIFQAGNITFEAGQAETAFEISFDNAEMGTNYAATLEITDTEYVSKYSNKATFLNFDVLVVAWQYMLNPKTGEPAVFTINSRWDNKLGPIHATLKYYEIGGVKTGIFTSIDKDKDGNLEGFWHSVPSVTLNIRWYSEKNNNGYEFVELPKQYFGYDYNGGNWLKVPLEEAATPIYAYDYAWYWVERGYNFGDDGMGANWLEEAKATGQMDGNYPVGYYDGNGGFFFNIYFFMPGLGGWSPDNYGTVAIADGFTRVDFSLALETDYPADGVTPVYVEAGADVASIKYAIYPGELKEDEVKDKVNAIAAGTEEATEFSEFELNEESGKNFATLGLSPETTGTYTIAVVGFDAAGAAQVAESLVFNFITADDQDDHAVQVQVGTEDVPARYGDYPTNSSFAFYIVGKNIQEAHINIYATETFNENQEAILAEMKAAETGSGVSVASASVLAEINAPGGFYTYTTGLKALTSYTVVVWATNGEMETWQTAEYTTDGLPNVLLTKGDYYYTGWFLKISGSTEESIVDSGLELYQNPNIDNTYVITHWGYDVDFIFTVDPKTNVIDWDYFYSGYSTGGIDLLVFNSKNIWSASYLEQHPELAKDSYYDPETGIYHFYAAYYAPGYGVQTCTWETFVPNKESGEEPTGIKFNSSSVSLSQATMSGVKDIQLPTREFKALPRDPQPVKANVTVSYTRKAKESGRNNMVVTRDSDQRFFE